MVSNRVLVTGATGFIGTNLVRRLVSQGAQVTCFVRPSSDISELVRLNCSFVYGDVVESPSALFNNINEFDTVFHLAASTHAVKSRELMRINVTGTRNVLGACAKADSPPVLVFVSSLSAVGPCIGTRPHLETDPVKPVSFYGCSKAACEAAAFEYSGQVPISIVRPPIVLGDGDRNGLELFRLIDKWGWHVVPGFSNHLFSAIHVDDLVTALINVASRGKRLASELPSQGIYFASEDRPTTYSELGRMVGRALGRNRIRILRVGRPVMWVAAMVNEALGRMSSSPRYLNQDKFREAFAGSWACSNERIRNEVGFTLTKPFQMRLEQTVEWYRRKGWLGQIPGVSMQATKGPAAN